MPSDTPRLTPLQHDVVRILWERGEGTVQDVVRALTPDRELAPSTVATLLRRLEARGVLAHETRGRQYVYRPLVRAEDARETAVADVTRTIFEGDLAAHAAQLLRSKDLRPGDLARIRELIERRERELGDG